jgi:hypothetical protein
VGDGKRRRIDGKRLLEQMRRRRRGGGGGQILGRAISREDCSCPVKFYCK